MRYCPNYFRFFNQKIHEADVASVEVVQISSSARTFSVVTLRDFRVQLWKITPRRFTLLGTYASEEDLRIAHNFARCIIERQFYPTDTMNVFADFGYVNTNQSRRVASELNMFYCSVHMRYEPCAIRNIRRPESTYIVGIPSTMARNTYIPDMCTQAFEETYPPLRPTGYPICSRCGRPYKIPEGQNPLNPTECIECCSFDGGAVPGYENDRINGYHSMQTSGNIIFGEGSGESDNRSEHLHIGAELEQMGDASSIARAASRIFGNTVAREHDCTVSIECITNPWTLKYWEEHRDHLAAFYKSVMAFGGEDDSESAGMHMHIDKAYFTDVGEAVAKLTYIFQKHWKNLIRFSRRKDSEPRWAHKPRWTPGCVKAYLNHEFESGGYDYRDHASAINLQHRSTIEIRIWNGTTDVTKLFATLKLTARLADIVKFKSFAEIESMTWEDILGNDEEILQVWNQNKERRLA